MEINLEEDYVEKPIPLFVGGYATKLNGNWKMHDGTVRKITMPRIDWKKIRNEENWEEWHFEGFKLYLTKEFKRWSLYYNLDVIGHLPYDTHRADVFEWAEGLILGRNIYDEKTIEELGGNPNMSFEKELPINVTLERAKIVNEWVPKEINNYRILADRCSELWNCNLDIKGAEQLLEEVFIRLKEEGIKPNFFQHRS